MNNYKILTPTLRGSFTERLAELEMLVGDWLELEQTEGRSLRYTKIFLSDAQNQHQQLVESDLFQHLLSSKPYTEVEQTPANGAKVMLLIMTSDTDNGALFHSLRLSDSETRGFNSYIQTIALFEKYISILRDMGLDMKTHLVRTWIYVADIDVNYSGVVKARNDIFAREGLTADTHFIASTGIGGRTDCRTACVPSTSSPIPTSRNPTRNISRHSLISIPPTNMVWPSSEAHDCSCLPPYYIIYPALQVSTTRERWCILAT